MNRPYLFYAANFDPEIRRVEQSICAHQAERTPVFIEKTLKLIGALLSAHDISSAGKEEWSLVRSLVASYPDNDAATNRALLAYGLPFSKKFARRVLR